MRIVSAAGLTAVALVSLAACSKSAPAAGGSSAVANAAGPLSINQIPHRKPGLWSQTISMDGGAVGGATQLCVDAASEAQMSLAAAQSTPGAQCAAPQFNRNLDGSLSFTAACDMGANGKIQTTGVIKGDFNSGYTSTMSSSTSGSPEAAMNGTHTMLITATWTGPCAPGQVGGDMVLANGMKMNVLSHLTPVPPSGENSVTP
jgi:hypothetical protein